MFIQRFVREEPVFGLARPRARLLPTTRLSPWPPLEALGAAFTAQRPLALSAWIARPLTRAPSASRDRAVSRTMDGWVSQDDLATCRHTPFGALNVGTTPTAVHVSAFAPGLDAKALEVKVEHGVLSISGERPEQRPETTSPNAAGDAPERPHRVERFTGRFERRVALPDDADADQVEARYADGVLHIQIARRPAPAPRRIDIH